MIRHHGEREETGSISLRALERETYGRFLYVAPRYTPNPEAELRSMLEAAARKATEAAELQRAATARQMALELKRLQEAHKAHQSGPTIAALMQALSDATGFSQAELTGPWRRQPLARARQMGYWLLRTRRPDLSYLAICRVFGRGKRGDLTAIKHGIRTFERYRKQAPLYGWLQHEAIRGLK